MRLRWPNLFVVGVAKGGTTSLWRYLDEHPAIYMSRVKEPNFFLAPGAPVAVRTEEAYLELFAVEEQLAKPELGESHDPWNTYVSDRKSTRLNSSHRL